MTAGVVGAAIVGVDVVAGDPAPLVLPPLYTTSRPQWAWAVGAWNQLQAVELSEATSRSLKMQLRGNHSATFTTSGTSYEAAQIAELVSDAWVTRNGVALFRGRIGPSRDDVDGTKHTVQFTAGDYRSLLDRRELFDSDTLTYTSADRSDIAWGLLSSTQGQPGGNLFITRGQGQSLGIAQTITYPAGQFIGQALSTLSLMDDGFDYDISPVLGQVAQTLDIWPARGQSRGRALSYPGNVASFTRTFDPATYANAIRETGDTGLAAVRVEASDIASRIEGRWDAQLGDTALLDATSVTARANKDLDDRQLIVPTYTLKLRPGEWGGPADIWLGDTVIVDVTSGRIASQGAQYRVLEIDVDLDENDNETVTITTGVLIPRLRFLPSSILSRLTSLERR